MEISPELTEKIQELQMLERNLQSFSMEKQSLQVEFNESINALSEIQKSTGDVYKILSGLMIKSDKSEIQKELSEKNKISELRINSIEKQEKSFEVKADALREEINAKISAKEKNNSK